MKWKHVCLGFIVFIILENCVLGHPFNNSTVEECSSNSDCATDKICDDLKCVDPCLAVCGLNAVCVVQDLHPICSCKPGFEGHPFTECKLGPSPVCNENAGCPQDRACVNSQCVDPCLDSCGLNSECRVVNHRHVCACKNGFFYNPQAGCQPISVPECQTSSHCADDFICRKQTCVDPCEGVCGNNTKCIVKDHHPACACKVGYSGDPFVDCQPQCMIEKKILQNTRYLIVNEQRSWFDAMRECRSRGMYLATVNNEKEWRDIQEAHQSMYQEYDLWLGGHDLGVFGQFIWVTSGRSLSYTNWEDGEPAGAANHCLSVSLHTSKWVSRGCVAQFYFVCETN